MGINSVEDKVKSLANKFGLTVGSWPLKYLGLLGDNPRTQSFWDWWLKKLKRDLVDGKKPVFAKVMKMAMDLIVGRGIRLQGLKLEVV